MDNIESFDFENKFPLKLDFDDIISDFKIKNTLGFKSYLISVWKELVNYSDDKNKGINKEIFCKYYELPPYISVNLFNVFNQTRNNYISLQEFFQGMIVLFCGSFYQQIKFIFRFYDTDHDTFISKDDIKNVLQYLPLNRQKLIQLNPNSDSKINDILTEKELESTLSNIFDNKEKLNEKEFLEIVERINSDIFIFILIFLLENRPFNNKTVELFEILGNNQREIGSSIQNDYHYITSPSSNSIFSAMITITNSPCFRRRSHEMKRYSLEKSNSNGRRYSKDFNALLDNFYNSEQQELECIEEAKISEYEYSPRNKISQNKITPKKKGLNFEDYTTFFKRNNLGINYLLTKTISLPKKGKGKLIKLNSPTINGRKIKKFGSQRITADIENNLNKESKVSSLKEPFSSLESKENKNSKEENNDLIHLEEISNSNESKMVV
ncbi:MAG: hypothetical protein MJ252_09940 [archaeon]|nr:hypothetical protein [archaeon]